MDGFYEVLSAFFTPEQYRKITGCTIGIAGAGGLGSNCAQILVRSGFCRFIIVDEDRVELSNLNRQLYTREDIGYPKVEQLSRLLTSINPACRVTPVYERFIRGNSTLFSDCSVLVEAFDDPVSKAALVETYAGRVPFIVCASGVAGVGNADRIVTRRIGDRIVCVGDGQTDTLQGERPYAPRVTVAAAKQADAVLGWVLGVDQQRLKT